MATVSPHVEVVCLSFAVPETVCRSDAPPGDVEAKGGDVLGELGELGDDVSQDVSKKSVKFNDGLLDEAACLEKRSSLSNVSTKSTLPYFSHSNYATSSEETSETWSECDKSDDGLASPNNSEALPGAKDSSEALLSAKEKWRKRREAKKAQKLLTKRPSYGDLLRKRTEQRKSDESSSNLLKPPSSGNSLKPPTLGNTLKAPTSPKANAARQLLVPTNEEMPCLVDHGERLTTIASCGVSEASSCVHCSPSAATMESLPDLHDEVAKPTLPCGESESEMSADESLPPESADSRSIPEVVIMVHGEQVVELERKLEELSRKYQLLQRENEVLKALAVQAEPFKNVLSCGPRAKSEQAEQPCGAEVDKEQRLQQSGGRCPTCGHWL